MHHKQQHGETREADLQQWQAPKNTLHIIHTRRREKAERDGRTRHEDHDQQPASRTDRQSQRAGYHEQSEGQVGRERDRSPRGGTLRQEQGRRRAVRNQPDAQHGARTPRVWILTAARAVIEAVAQLHRGGSRGQRDLDQARLGIRRRERHARTGHLQLALANVFHPQHSGSACLKWIGPRGLKRKASAERSVGFPIVEVEAARVEEAQVPRVAVKGNALIEARHFAAEEGVVEGALAVRRNERATVPANRGDARPVTSWPALHGSGRQQHDLGSQHNAQD
ncbi:MAG: hypothetical protein NTY23_09185 [Chloroflexi bacterium]|nr:hypothetical protein [Chloroflexota bacterium]